MAQIHDRHRLSCTRRPMISGWTRLPRSNGSNRSSANTIWMVSFSSTAWGARSTARASRAMRAASHRSIRSDAKKTRRPEPAGRNLRVKVHSGAEYFIMHLFRGTRSGCQKGFYLEITFLLCCFFQVPNSRQWLELSLFAIASPTSPWFSAAPPRPHIVQSCRPELSVVPVHSSFLQADDSFPPRAENAN